MFPGCVGHLFTYIFYLIADTQEAKDPTIVIVYPDGQDVELLCGLRRPSGNESAAWTIDQAGPYGVNSLANGILDGYSADLLSNNLLIKNITTNDDRNNTEYQCVTFTPGTFVGDEQIVESGDVIILYVAGEYQYRKSEAMHIQCDVFVISYMQ